MSATCEVISFNAQGPDYGPTNDVCRVVFSADVDVVWEVDEVSACEDGELFVEVVCASEVLVGGGLDVEEALSDDTEVVLFRVNQSVRTMETLSSASLAYEWEGPSMGSVTVSSLNDYAALELQAYRRKASGRTARQLRARLRGVEANGEDYEQSSSCGWLVQAEEGRSSQSQGTETGQRRERALGDEQRINCIQIRPALVNVNRTWTRMQILIN